MADPVGGFSVVSNIWIRQMHFQNEGDVMSGHKHTFDHATLCAVGKFEVTLEDEIHSVEAPCILYIEASKEHSIKAVTADAIAYCIHGIHDPKDWGTIINPDMMPQFNGSIEVPLLESDSDLVKK